MVEANRGKGVKLSPRRPQACRVGKQSMMRKHRLPFVGLPDPQHSLLNLYNQQVKLSKLGGMQAQVIGDITGQVRFVYYGHFMNDISPVSDILANLEGINYEQIDQRYLS